MPQTHSTQSSSKGADYIVIVSTEDDFHCSYHDFAERVNRKLRAGYQLHGQPFSVSQTLCQAMVRLDGSQTSGETTVFYKYPEDQYPR